MRLFIFGLMVVIITGCQLEDMTGQVVFEPIACVNGFQWDLNGNEIVDDVGAQIECTND